MIKPKLHFKASRHIKVRPIRCNGVHDPNDSGIWPTLIHKGKPHHRALKDASRNMPSRNILEKDAFGTMTREIS